ncbi:MAG: phosphatidylserine decarboxylase family protein [Spirochaetales bacterium]|nr:phosphatidylserine decarboxylase family protein [Spirochaetales bacterium]MCK5607699.1 phosphatidylserine decarboxylase family protein [Candidatus Pacearchaeota archaeon]
MVLRMFFSSVILSLIILIPLGIKWEIDKKVLITSTLFIGITVGTIVYGLSMFLQLRFYQLIIVELLNIAVIAIALLLWRFYRNPERIPPEPDNLILSPADGRIIYIKRIQKGEIPFSEKKGRRFSLHDFVQTNINFEGGYLIGIAMSYLDVHVNRTPVRGRIILMKRIKGLYISLKRKEAVLQNERLLTVIDNGHFKTGIVQITSRLVRKIIPFLNEGQEIQKGERMGMIRFGSQVDLLLPDLPSLRINVKLNDKVKACTCVIASFNNTVMKKSKIKNEIY